MTTARLAIAVEQRLGAGHVMDLPGRDQEAERAAFRIDPRVDLLAEASSASAHTFGGWAI